MPDLPVAGGTIARTVDELFVELICADKDLLAAEFDAIVAAQWAGPPANPIYPSVPGRHSSSGAAHRPAGLADGQIQRARHPGLGEWARQRSPPPSQPLPNRERR